MKAKCLLRVERLRNWGMNCGGRRLTCFGIGIYELRASLQGVHYRVLYFFHGAVAAVVAHRVVKESAVPPKEIDRAIERRKRFEANPAKHRQSEENTA